MEAPIETHDVQRSTGRRSYALPHEGELARVRSHIRADLGRVGADPSGIFDCLVAVTEACSNALRHGHGEAAPRLTWHIQGDRVRFCVRDFSGQAWSRSVHPSGTARHRAGVDERVGGFGLELMHGLMDEVEIRVDSDGTVVQLAKVIRV